MPKEVFLGQTGSKMIEEVRFRNKKVGFIEGRSELR